MRENQLIFSFKCRKSRLVTNLCIFYSFER